MGSSSTMVAAILLAGGHGRRAGGPKALKTIDGQLLWAWQTRQLLAGGVTACASVLHPRAFDHAEPIEGCSLVRAEPDTEMIGSLQLGLMALGESAKGPLVILPVDCPYPGHDVLRALLSATHRYPGAQVLRPQAPNGRRGHPIVLRGQLIETVAAADPRTARLDHMIKALPDAARRDVPVAHERVLANFNRDGISR